MSKVNIEKYYQSLVRLSSDQMKYISSTAGIFSSTVLVVENGEKTHDLISQFLCRAGYQVVTVRKGDQAIEIIQNLNDSTTIDLIIFNLMLPEPSGVEICQFLRSHGSKVPILMLSSQGQEADLVLGLEMGADDYLVKPFGSSELLARCYALLRRDRLQRNLPATLKPDLEETIEFGDIKIYPQQCRVTIKGKEILLSPKEFLLLSLFIRNPRRIFSRDLLIDRVWGAKFMGNNKTVDVHIRWLRSKIEDNPCHPTYLLTVRGFGYCFG
jgi:two-component system, OmpR family, phosphate regulon response regulator PhoB